MFRLLWLGLVAGCGGSDDAGPADPTEGDTDTDTDSDSDADSDADADTDSDADTDPIWVPTPGTTWQWQLQGAIDTTFDVEVYDIDLFDVPNAVLDALHTDGRKVICYFSAGSWEEWRDDADDFDAADLGSPLEGWPGERWLDVRSVAVRSIMQARLDLAASRGCDAVEPDNVDGYSNNNGLGLTEADQLDYNRFLAAEAHSRGLSVGLKNSVDLVNALESDFDWALNEECLTYDECTTTAPFIAAGKAVFHVEYVNRENQGPAAQSEVCGDPTITGFSTLIKTWDLTARGLACK